MTQRHWRGRSFWFRRSFLNETVLLLRSPKLFGLHSQAIMGKEASEGESKIAKEANLKFQFREII